MDNEAQVSPASAPGATAEDRRRDEVLCRMLNMPYRPHPARLPILETGLAPADSKRAGPRRRGLGAAG